jgi:molybdopterin-guanine dinucleotide biosynthesis protein A
MKVTSIVLAGGKNRRLGRSKALEVIGGKDLIDRVVEGLEPLSEQTIIVTSQDKSDLPIASKVEILVDLYPDKGPLGGIYTGLSASWSLYNLVTACDMPFLNTELLRYMIKISKDFDAVVPRLDNGMLEPLHAIYSKTCLSKIKRQLEKNELETYSIFNNMHVRYIEKTEYHRFDPQSLSFFNINYQSDLEKAIKLATKNEKADTQGY